MMQPAMPFGWNSARIIDAVVHDPASRKASNSLATFIIDIAVGIMAAWGARARGWSPLRPHDATWVWHPAYRG